MHYIRACHGVEWVITIEEGSPVTYTASMIGHYLEQAPGNAVLPTAVIPNQTPVDSQNWVVSVDGTDLDLAVTSATITIPSGLQNRGFVDGQLNFNRIVNARRKGSVEIEAINTTEVKQARELINTLDETTFVLTSTGPAIRADAPLIDRKLEYTLHGQVVAQGEFYQRVDGFNVQSLTLETLANADDKDIEIDCTVASDEGTGRLV